MAQSLILVSEKLKILELLKSNITSAEDAALFAQEVSEPCHFLETDISDQTLIRESRLCVFTRSKIQIPKMEHLGWP